MNHPDPFPLLQPPPTAGQPAFASDGTRNPAVQSGTDRSIIHSGRHGHPAGNSLHGRTISLFPGSIAV